MKVMPVKSKLPMTPAIATMSVPLEPIDIPVVLATLTSKSVDSVHPVPTLIVLVPTLPV